MTQEHDTPIASPVEITVSGVLFLCVANSARSQMAEGLARAMAPPDVAIFSAGSAPRSVHPNAIAVMRELGVELSTHRSKDLSEVEVERVSTVITLCAEEFCPTLGNAQHLHWPLDDPAADAASDEAQLAEFRRVRDDIGARLRVHFGW